MSFTLAALLTERLLAFALFLQAVEMFFVCRSKVFNSVWSYANVHDDLESGVPFPRDVTRLLFGRIGFLCLVSLQIVFALAAFIFPLGVFFVILTVTHLLICFRFRGSFNGGSDMMTFVVLTGVLILTFGPTEQVQRLGLLYIAIQALYSYVKAGAVKLRVREWRNGSALSAFLARSVFTDMKRAGVMLRFKPTIARALAWALILFEVSALALLFFHRGLHVYFALAVLFHFAIYRAFGLNRFFWIWLAAWPSLFALSSLT